MMLIEASCPSNRLAAVTKRTGCRRHVQVHDRSFATGDHSDAQ